jgi:hypothetical protein
VQANQPKVQWAELDGGAALARPSQLSSLGLGLLGGLLGSLPAWFASCDSTGLLIWIACVSAAIGAWLGLLGLDPLRFGAVAPALWAVALALLGAGEERASLPTPIWGALAWSGIFFAGMALGRLRRTAGAVGAVLLLAATLVALPIRGALPGRPWPAAAASTLMDLSPFVLLGECSGARDMAWHRSLYEAAGTDRFQRRPWDPIATSLLLLGVGLGLAVFVDRRARLGSATASQ